MIVKHAKEAARQWVIEQASPVPGFSGAFFHGSTNWLPEDAPISATSDLDVMVVLADANPPVKPGKLTYRDIMLDVSYIPREQLQSPELVLGQYHLAGSFHAPSVIVDPSGHLTKLQEAVSANYAKRQWVVRRCDHARAKILHGLTLNESDLFHDQVVAWLFPAGIMTHVLLVAGLANPTVRQRYLAAHKLLAYYDHLDFYEALLELLGCAQMSRRQVEQHLAALTDAFDAAKTMVKTPFFFASDISDTARPIAIDGSSELIARGFHREAIFWIVATYSRCQNVLYQDGPAAMRDQFSDGYRNLLADLGIRSFRDLQQRSEQVRRTLPRVWNVAEAIMAANPGIEDEPDTVRLRP